MEYEITISEDDINDKWNECTVPDYLWLVVSKEEKDILEKIFVERGFYVGIKEHKLEEE